MSAAPVPAKPKKKKKARAGGPGLTIPILRALRPPKERAPSTAAPLTLPPEGPEADRLAWDGAALDGPRGPITTAPPRDHEITVRGKRIVARRFGPDNAEAALIAAHGWGAHGGRWTPLAQSLAARVAVIAPDLPGYGRSDPPPEDENPIFAHDAAALAEIARDAAPRLHLIASGFGAEGAVRAALRFPDRVDSLTLIEPAAFALLEQAQDPRRMEAHDLALGVLAMIGFGDAAAASRRMAEFWGGEGAVETLTEEARAYLGACAPRAEAEMRALSFRAPGALLFEDYQRITAPMLVIYSERAPLCLRAAAARILRAAPAARLETLQLGRPFLSPLAADGPAARFLEEQLGRPEAP
ncbi:MAG: alpha/beta hydrolase [Pseudomonadota bacterium]